ncbi:MAG: hypothetical protein JWO52_3483, partial [Gammaproteobacteria bacterium]|nr:hypothetical protein [Gammaproteobacteria bacterium]
MSEFPPPKYVEDITCRETWTETSQVLIGPPGTVKIELCVYRWTPEVPVHIDRIVPVVRVTMTTGLAQMLRDQLTAALENIQKQADLAQ